MYTVLERAILFALDAHKGQTRKDGRPFILHPMEDAAIVSTMTGDPEILAAAVLHDTVEDTGVTEAQILDEFGPRIHDLVMGETEEKRPTIPPEETWRVRKEESLQKLAACDDIAVKMLWLGDKLSNIRALHRDYDAMSIEIFSRFNNPDPLAQRWYFSTVMNCLEELSDTCAFQEYANHFHAIFDHFEGDAS